jgi:hypothetical protein
MPIVLLALRGGGIERNPSAQRLAAALGNVTFLERPFHPTTLVSVVETALRGRRRQYEARDRIETIRAAEALLERRVEERTAELASANRQLAGQIAERERVEGVLRQTQRLEAVGQLTSGVAHDFNNLLMVVLGNIRQMQKTVTDPVSQRRLQMMTQAAERGAQLTAQMLAFSRRQRLEPCAVDLNDTVAGMRDLLQATMGGSVRIETVLQPQLWPAMIDPTQIELVILNLAINARDAMEVGGTLVVETGNVALAPPARPEEPAAGDYVMVAVTDTGSSSRSSPPRRSARARASGLARCSAWPSSPAAGCGSTRRPAPAPRCGCSCPARRPRRFRRASRRPPRRWPRRPETSTCCWSMTTAPCARSPPASCTTWAIASSRPAAAARRSTSSTASRRSTCCWWTSPCPA